VKRLLVVADDLGLTPGVNAGIATAFREGILTSASLLTNTRHFGDTVSLARSLAGLKVGIHLTLVGGPPVLQAAQVPSLAGSDGLFRRSWRRFLPAWWAGRIRQDEVQAEWRAQISRAVQAGIRPTHLDSHQHLHVLPELWRITLQLAAEFHIPRVRLPREVADDAPATPLARRLVRRALARLCPAPPNDGPVRCCEHFFGISETGRLDEAALRAVLRRIPDGWSELIAHPGIPDAELRHDYPWGYRWQEEARALASPGAREELDQQGITLEKT
jgi:hopanoid biosynthesis associated protein HpnK